MWQISNPSVNGASLGSKLVKNELFVKKKFATSLLASLAGGSKTDMNELTENYLLGLISTKQRAELGTSTRPLHI